MLSKMMKAVFVWYITTISLWSQRAFGWVLPPLNNRQQATSSCRIYLLQNNDEINEGPVTTSRRQWFNINRNCQQQQQADADDTLPKDRSSFCISPLNRRTWLRRSLLGAASIGVGMQPCRADDDVVERILEKSKSYDWNAKLVESASSCDASVSVWEKKSSGRRVYLLGTAHISEASAQLAGQLVDDVRPEAVFVELDSKRVKGRQSIPRVDGSGPSLQRQEQEHQPTTPTISGPRQQEPPPQLASSSSSESEANGVVSMRAAVLGAAIKGMYKKLNSKGFQSGEEFMVAMKEAQRIGATIVLGDRDVEITLRRASEALGHMDLSTLSTADLDKSLKDIMPTSSSQSQTQQQAKIPNPNDETFKNDMTDYVETMKKKENVRAVMSKVQQVAPELYDALVGERDAYMANGLDNLKIFPSIVAVMGIAHIDGVERNLKEMGWKAVPLMCR